MSNVWAVQTPPAASGVAPRPHAMNLDDLLAGMGKSQARAKSKPVSGMMSAVLRQQEEMQRILQAEAVEAANLFRASVEAKIKAFVADASQNKLCFPNETLEEQRVTIHELSANGGLFSVAEDEEGDAYGSVLRNIAVYKELPEEHKQIDYSDLTPSQKIALAQRMPKRPNKPATRDAGEREGAGGGAGGQNPAIKLVRPVFKPRPKVFGPAEMRKLRDEKRRMGKGMAGSSGVAKKNTSP